jgi:hypothetical protein
VVLAYRIPQEILVHIADALKGAAYVEQPYGSAIFVF